MALLFPSLGREALSWIVLGVFEIANLLRRFEVERGRDHYVAA
jgi:hypothetical protein